MTPTVLVIGRPGSGKTTSILKNEDFDIEGIPPDKLFYINIAQKMLPFRNSLKLFKEAQNPEDVSTRGYNYLSLHSSEYAGLRQICQQIYNDRKDINVVVIDDYNYTMGFKVMDYIDESNEVTWDDWKRVASLGVSPVRTVNALSGRDDIVFVFICHPEKDKDGDLKAKTAGQMIDNLIELDGLFTVVLYTERKRNISTGDMEYKFLTRKERSSAKDGGMFSKSEKIPNDLGRVVNTIFEYLGSEQRV